MTDIIKVKNLNYSYKGHDKILEDVSFSLDKKDLVAIIGHNGSGKSTLIKLLLGILEPLKGTIKISDKLAYIPQSYNQDSNFPGKVKEILELECCDCDLRDKVTDSLDINHLKEKQFKSLSGGQQQRVLISLALLSNPEILILDEPTVGVDAKTQEEFYKLLKQLNKERKITILFVTHDTGMISNYFSKTICVENGKVHIDDAKKTKKLLKDIYGNNFSHIDHAHHNHGGNE